MAIEKIKILGAVLKLPAKQQGLDISYIYNYVVLPIE